VTVRGNSEIRVIDCLDCSLAFLSNFDHISPSHYENSGMWDKSVIDVNEWIENTKKDDLRRASFLKNLAEDKSVLDIGTGNGNFLTEIRSVANEVVGIEPEKRLAESFEKRNLKILGSLEEVKTKFDLVTMFHVLEHVPDPINFLESAKNTINQDGTLIIEVPNLNDALLKIYDSHAFSNFTFWDNHLYTYNSRTLKTIIEKAGFQSVKIFGIQRYSLANHLYWISRSKPGGHEIWDFIDSKELQVAYEDSLAKLDATDTLVAIATDFENSESGKE
jgi:2-polyprenyl-3-methyl-5-hydroxy-6-metoxy-1,4-benzoquinol methylase